MPDAVIHGLSRDVQHRVRGGMKRLGLSFRVGWAVHFVPAPGRQVGIPPSQTAQIAELAAELGGAHLLGFSKRDGRMRQQVARELRPYFRFLWVKNVFLGLISHAIDEFVIAINEVLEHEEIWISEVKPKDVKSALLLPHGSFRAEPPVSNIWSLALEFGDVKVTHAFGSALQRFRVCHWKNAATGSRLWVDSKNLVFDHSGPRHGRAPGSRNWKYSFAIPDGFHFDVTSSSCSSFRLRDALGNERAVGGRSHVNIDPHGYIR